MTIYYLYVKTHNITGLKYLGKTTKDPYKYLGSGIDWCKHLKQYGKNITTEIIKVCETHEEFSYWGRYYSKLWNIVCGQDDFGNRIWANRIPETGGGLGVFGDANPMRNPEVVAKRTGPNHHAKTEESRRRQSINNPMHNEKSRRKLSQTLLARGENHHARKPESIKKRSGENHYAYDSTVYTWRNIKTNEILHMTRTELIRTFNLNKSHVCQMIKRNPKFLSVKNWELYQN